MRHSDFQPLKVGLLSGGDSSERAVSLRSGRAVWKALQRAGLAVHRHDPRNWGKQNESIPRMDVAFIALHGKGGEDGSIQAALERAGIPYVGSDPQGSRLAFDKVEAKKRFERAGIPTPPWRTVSEKNWKELEHFPSPFFVKPIREGSSIGVFLVEDFHQEAEKIKRALKRYGVLLAEKKIEGREFTVGILGRRALPVVELRTQRKFYDYRAKYTPGMTEYFVPAPLPERWGKEFQRIALRVHEVLGLRDFSRIDLMANSQGEASVLEANTIPGFTELSLLPKAARAAGISFESLCLRLVKMAWERRNGKA